MFKKSLLILMICGFLTLATTVGYVLLRFRGPEDTLSEAQSKLSAGAYADVITLLNQAEPSASIVNDKELREQLWRLRYAANELLGNPGGALKDVDSLLANGHANDIDLQLDKISLLAKDGQGDKARQAAKQFIETHPDHGRALELAGEACQTAYQPMLKRLQDLIADALESSQREQASKLILEYLYRPSGDPLISHAESQLSEMFSPEPRLQMQWLPVQEAARELRERIQEGLSYFQRGLDVGGEPVAAFWAIATALEQSGRIDDVLFACEIQRRMFDHAYVIDSGVLSAWVRIQNNSPESAIACSDRWLPLKEIPKLAEAGTLTPTFEQLGLARALAAWQLRDKTQLGISGSVVHELREAGFRSTLPLQVSMATKRIVNNSDETKTMEEGLEKIVNVAIHEPPPINRPDFVAEFAPYWIDSLRARNASEAETLGALNLWREGRPNAVAPMLRTANYLMSLRRTEAALTALDAADKIAPDHPELFPLRLDIARQRYENTTQDGPGLLAQCIKQRRQLPETDDAIGFVLCAETALQSDQKYLWRIALKCARNAINAFPRANLPRQLELQALLRADRFEEAAQTATLVIDTITPNAATFAIAIKALRLADQPVRGLIRQAISLLTQSPQMQVELLGLALIDAPSTADKYVTDALIAENAPLEHRLLAIRAFTASGRLEQAYEQLKLASIASTPIAHESLTLAFADWLAASAKNATDDELCEILREQRTRLALNKGPQRALLATATDLASSHPLTAFDLVTVAIPAALPEERNGSLYILAGDLALAHKDSIRASAYWVAALGFRDGLQVAERLARLELLLGNEEQATNAYELVQTPTDPALAACFNKTAIADGLLATNLQTKPADLLTHATLATMGQPAMVDWKPSSEELVQRSRLELIAGLADPLLSFLCAPRAATLMQESPNSNTVSLLLARVSADSANAPAAGKLHAKVFRKKMQNSILLHEVAYAGQHDNYTTNEALLQLVMTAAASGDSDYSLPTVAYGTREIVKRYAAGNFLEIAQQTRMLQWLTRPHLLPMEADDLTLVTSKCQPRDACIILDQVLNGPHECDRAAILTNFYQLAPKALAVNPQDISVLAPIAQRHLSTEGPLGAIVHFLLVNPIDSGTVDITTMLLAHLELVAAAQDSPVLLDWTMDALTDQVSPIEAIDMVGAILDRYPTSLPLWAAHVKLRARIPSDRSALTDLRTVLTHAHDPHAEMAFLSLAASSRKLTPQDITRLQQFPTQLVNSPAGEYILGVIAMRQGKPDEAIARLLKAEPQHDGRHLYELALAHLESSDENGAEKARATLERLLKNYESSSLSRHAGSFIRQLSPRKESAVDSVSNR